MGRTADVGVLENRKSSCPFRKSVRLSHSLGAILHTYPAFPWTSGDIFHVSVELLQVESLDGLIAVEEILAEITKQNSKCCSKNTKFDTFY